MYPREDVPQYGSRPQSTQDGAPQPSGPPYGGQQYNGQQYGGETYGENRHGGTAQTQQFGPPVPAYEAPRPPYGSPSEPPMPPGPPAPVPYNGASNNAGKRLSRAKVGGGVGALLGLLFARAFGRLILSLGVSTVVLVVVAGIGWYAYDKYGDQVADVPELTTDAPRTAKVGECLEQSGAAEEDLKIVDCKAPTAKYKVAGVVPDVGEVAFNFNSDQLCSEWEKTDTAYWEGIEKRAGTVLCLEALKKK